MDPRFMPHNLHLEEPLSFPERDPHLRLLRNLPLVHRSPLLDVLPRRQPGIYSVSGGRQVGKTTLLKQWMARLLEAGVEPAGIAYLTGELIEDHHSLVRLVSEWLEGTPATGLQYLIIDEVTYTREWDRGVKYLADAGMIADTVLVLTGSDMALIRDARARLPGRRGISDRVDFHLYPLDFHECVRLKGLFTEDECRTLLSDDLRSGRLLDRLCAALTDYLCHGGFLTAINDLARHGRILPATFATYSDWIRGDVLKRNRREVYLREILGAIVRRYGSQITWNSLAKDLSIDHPKTVIDYVELLTSMDAVFVQAAVREDRLAAAPKKARKVIFTDPFVFHAVYAWLHPGEDPYHGHCRRLLEDDAWSARLVEACATGLYRRFFPTYYIKAAGEVDIAYVADGRLWPVEIKWTRQPRPAALKQVTRYANARILTRRPEGGRIAGLPAEPLALALFRLGHGAG